MTSTQKLEDVLTKCQRIAKLSKDFPERAFVSLAHHIDETWLHEAYRRTRKDGAVGVDNQSAEQYSEALEENLRTLLNRAKGGHYKALPVRRVYIPKSGGKMRPLGIPAFEDKVLQRAIVMLMEAIYEQDFHPDSYGFRPGRSAHMALSVLERRLRGMGGGWVIELDIQSFFDCVDHGLLRELIQQRIKDGVINRLIGKWLNAGLMENGELHHPNVGTPQGGVISPLLANIYLHHVLDKWFEEEVQPRLSGRSSMVRYADDAVLLFSNEQDAQRVMEVLPKRFGRYGLTLHPEKTRLIKFKPPRLGCDDQDRGSFNMLGFTHFWGKTRKGGWAVKRKTANDRFRRALKGISEWCKINRQVRVRDQHKILTSKLRGHYSYYGLSGNYKALSCFRFLVERVWVKWLSRRSQRGHLNWEKASRLLKLMPLPMPRITKSTVF